ncbi:hypothetical protein MARPU_04310 [Marichromatium purpuratum 984]|uniref:Lipoprotein n=1 Tax=Marichromatium purpuratum 984 TaxID=765910 RepID=W0E298_MARPU|nr:hypothetical protein [Marichromatium purpuratum]AHF03191.1 hypothetical protein MARPU_04310 [Marichromatium purpuratum 984]
MTTPSTHAPFALTIALLGALTLTGCEQEGPAEEAGRKIDQQAEQVGQQLEQARDAVTEALEDAGDRLEQATDQLEGSGER